jgi:4-alpha-glucanotransferase
MNVWQFSESEIRNMPEEEALQRVFYSGTHDNQTLLGWCSDNNRDNGSPVARAKEIIEELYAAGHPG